MSESRITGGNISNILKVSEVERLGFTEVYAFNKKEKGDGNTTKNNLFFEFPSDGEYKWYTKKPLIVTTQKLKLPYISARILSKALEEINLYLANARLIYPAISINFNSLIERKIRSGIMMGWGDLYKDKEIELETFIRGRNLDLSSPMPSLN